MIFTLIYFISILLILLFFVLLTVYISSLIYSSFKGSPYVPTKRKILQKILKEAGLKKGDKFIDIGCGDGRVVEEAIVSFGAIGTGVDINPLLITQARINAKIKNIKNAKYMIKDLNDIDLTKFNFVYIFLMPEFITKITSKIKPALMNKVKIVSHGFKIPYLEKYLKKTIPDKSFPTYIYSVI